MPGSGKEGQCEAAQLRGGETPECGRGTTGRRGRRGVEDTSLPYLSLDIDVYLWGKF